ncbi:MAG: 16S rRNA processing protein RimM [Muribaculaceae bacterium]|nr:16S rRNA processing protein RimM [Muribaculaceae bacterium]
MITRDELIAIGRYNKPHGVAGEISATIDVDLDTLQGLSCLVTDIDGIFVPFFVNACRPKSQETVLLTIDGIDNEKEISRLVNHDIYALKRDYRQESLDSDADGFPLDYFIGFELRDSDGQRVGEITDVDEQTENAIFIVDREGAELMVPATDELIVEFDLDKKVMVMDLPQGLLDLND